MKVSTPRAYLQKRRAARRLDGPLTLVPSVLADELVRPVGLDLEDVELRVQRVVRLRRELEAPAEDPVLDLHPLDVPEHVAPAEQLAAVGVAGELDRVQQHLGRAVARRAERADRLAGVVLL